MTIIALGNRDAATAVTNEDGTKKMEALPKGKRATIVNFPDDYSLGQCLRALTDGDGVINNHFASGAKPAWVAGDDETLVDLLAAEFGGIEVRPLELEGGAVAPDTDEEVSK